jgi:sporulation protein YlmC with PRC-barrel domain
MPNMELDKVKHNEKTDLLNPTPSLPDGQAPEAAPPAAAHQPAMGEGCELPLRFEIGSRVLCADGPCGKLNRVVLDPATENATHLIVTRGVVRRHDVVVPVSAVKEAAGQNVRLKVAGGDLDGYKRYRDVDFRVPVVGWRSDRYAPQHVVYAMSPYEGIGGQSLTPSKHYHFHEGIPFNLRAVGKGTKVHNAEGPLGEIDHVLVDCAQGHITHLVVQHGMRREYRIVPVQMVQAVDDSGLTLLGDHDDLTGLPRYQR